jgi:hypothetical protein
VPFSLVAAATSASLLANDLYVPTGRFQHGLAVYRGTDTGRYAFACDPALLAGRWALSSTDDETAWSRCDGELWLDTQSNRLSTANPTSADTEASDKDRQYGSAYAEPVVYRFNFEGCTAFLPAVVMSMPVATFAAACRPRRWHAGSRKCSGRRPRRCCSRRSSSSPRDSEP